MIGFIVKRLVAGIVLLLAVSIGTFFLAHAAISDPTAATAMKSFRKIALKPEAIARAIAHVINQPSDVDTSEIVVRPTASPA